jgi:hypothetical protein
VLQKVEDLLQLQNQPSLWKKIKTVNLTAGQQEAVIIFSIPITATNLLFEFAVVSEGSHGSDRLTCPRCGNTVTDRHSGICRNCHENAYQCRQCRNINYENLTAFIVTLFRCCSESHFVFCSAMNVGSASMRNLNSWSPQGHRRTTA